MYITEIVNCSVLCLFMATYQFNLFKSGKLMFTVRNIIYLCKKL